MKEKLKVMKTKRFSLITILAVILIACITIFGISFRAEKSASPVFADENSITIGDGTNGTTKPKQLKTYISEGSSYIKNQDFSQAPKTFEMVVKLNAESKHNHKTYGKLYGVVLGGFGTAAEEEFCLEFIYGSQARIFWGGWDEPYCNWVTGITVETQSWQHLVFTIDNTSVANQTTLKFYLNGELAATKTVGYKVADIPLTSDFFIGSDSRQGIGASTEFTDGYNDQRGFQGSIRYIGLSSDIKTGAEIATAYNNSITYTAATDYGLDREFVDPVVDDGPITSDTVLAMRFNTVEHQLPNAFGVDFSDGKNSYQLSSALTSSPYTFETVVKLANTTNGLGRQGAVMGSFNVGSNNFNIEFYPDSNKIKPRFFWTKDGTASDSDEVDWKVDYDMTPHIGKWAHVVFIRNKTSKQLECYINGTLVATRSGIGADFASYAKHWIGRDNRTTSYFQGEINYLGVSKAVKTAQDVKESYIKNRRLVSASDSNTQVSIEFSKAFYRVKTPISKTFNTFTATINLSKSIPNNVRPGVIYGTYAGSDYSVDAINVEIHENGKLRIYYNPGKIPSSGDDLVNLYSTYDFRQDKDLHIILVRNKSAGTFTLYVYDGTTLVTTETLTPSTDAGKTAVQTDLIPINAPAIGNDLRGGGTAQYTFMGTIKDVAIYSAAFTSETAKEEAGKTDKTKITYTSCLGNWVLNETQQKLIHNKATEQAGDVVDYKYANNAELYTPRRYYEPTNNNWYKVSNKNNEYSIIFLPDTQTSVRHTSHTMDKMFDWIVANQGNMNLKFVLGLGDIQDGVPSVSTEPTGDGDTILNTTEQWIQMQKNYKKLSDAGILWSAIMGNHDYDSNSPTAANGRKANLYNTYFGYDTLSANHKTKIVSQYAKNEIQNVIYTFEGGGVNYLVVSFEFGPSDSMLEWASSVISQKQYANHRVIVTTHSLVFSNGEFNNGRTIHNPENYGFGSTPGININNGSQMWDEFLSKHDNIFMAASGHIIHDNVMKRYDVGEFGNTVLSMLIDGQGVNSYNLPTYGSLGDSLLMVAKINESNKTVTFNYYNPVNNSLFSIQNQFTYNFTNSIKNKQIVLEDKDLSTNQTNAISGETVTITVNSVLEYGKPYAYWKPVVTTASGTAVACTVNGKTFTFTMPNERVYVDVEQVALASEISMKIDEVRDLSYNLPTGYTIEVSGNSVSLEGKVLTAYRSGNATLTIKNASSENVAEIKVAVSKEIFVEPSVIDKYLKSPEFKSHETGARLRLMWTEYNCGITFVGQIPTAIADAVSPKLLIVPQYYLDGIRSSTTNEDYARATDYLDGGDYLTALKISGLPYKVVENPYKIQDGEITLLLGGLKAIQDTNMNRAMFGIYFYEYAGTTYYAKIPEGLEQNVSRSMAYVVSGFVNDYAVFDNSNTSLFTGTNLDEHAEEVTKKFLTRAVKDAVLKTKTEEYKKTMGTKQAAETEAKKWISTNISSASLDFSSPIITDSDKTVEAKLTKRRGTMVTLYTENSQAVLSATYFDTRPTYDLQLYYITPTGAGANLNVKNILDFKPTIEVITAGENFIEIDRFGNINVKGVTSGVVTDAIKVNFAYQNKGNNELQTYAFDLEANKDYVDLGVPTQYYEDVDNQPTQYKPNANVTIKPNGTKRLKPINFMVVPEYGDQSTTQGQVIVNGTNLVGSNTLVTGSASQNFKIDSEANRVYTLTVKFETRNGVELRDPVYVEVGPGAQYAENQNANRIYTQDVKTTDGQVLGDVMAGVTNNNPQNNLNRQFARDYYWLEGRLTSDETITVTYSDYDIWDGTRANGFARGNGTESNPYIIETAEQLAYMAKISFDKDYGKGMYFELAKSLNLANISWTPICFDAGLSYAWNWFQGTFNGNGYSIYNLNIDGSYVDASGNAGTKAYGFGLFGAIGTDGVVKNLTIAGTVNVTHRAGTVAYYLGNNAKIENVKNYANVTTDKASNQVSYAGGIVGTMAKGNSIITDCTNYGKVNATGGHVGGITGNIETVGADIINCENYGEIIGGFSTGGIAGTVNQTIHNCRNYAQVAVTNKVSSIIDNDSEFLVVKVADKSIVTASVDYEVYGTRIGGIIGHNGNGGAMDCENWGTVTGKRGACNHTWALAGALAGKESEYTLKDALNNMGVGGICGYDNRGGAENCVNYGIVNGCDGHTGKEEGASLNYGYTDPVIVVVRFYDEQGRFYTSKTRVTENGVWLDGRSRDNDHDLALYYDENNEQVRGSIEDVIAHITKRFNYDKGGNYLPDKFWWSGQVDGDTIIEVRFSEADVWDGSVATKFAGGSGTEADPYLISTGAQLAYLSNLSYGKNYGEGKYFKLTNSIDLNGHEWQPIGWSDQAKYHNQEVGISFRGSFDGNGYTIAGLYCSNRYGNSSAVGLFGNTYKITIKDLVVQGNLTASQRVGGIAYQLDYVKAFNVYSYVDVTATGEGEGKYTNNTYEKLDEGKYRYAGSFAAHIKGSSVITDCGAYGNVITSNNVERVGAGVGSVGSSTLINFTNYGSITSDSPYVGGIIGSSATARVYNCTNYGNVTATKGHVGGIIGEMTNYTTVYDCVNYGDITGTDMVGGCLGYVGAGGTYKEMTNNGEVSGTTTKVGDIVGWDNANTTESEGINQYYDANGNKAYDEGEEYYVITVNYFYEDGTLAHAPKIICVHEGYFGKDTPSLSVGPKTADNLQSPTISGYLPNMFWVSGYADEDKTFNVIYSEASSPWDGTTIATSFAGGNGTKYNPYLIETAEQLALMSKIYNNPSANYGGNTYYKLVKSIDLNDKTWTPIGWKNSSDEAVIASAAFEGYFDGNGKTIAGLYRNWGFGLGLFQTFSGVATNLTIEGSIYGDSHIAGFAAVLGTAGKAGNIDGIKSFVDVSNNLNYKYWYASGVVGKAQSSTVNNCHSYGEINAVSIRLGGVVGGAIGASTITNSNNYGPINMVKGANSQILSNEIYADGGVVGVLENTNNNTLALRVNNCINYADIASSFNTLGGVVGQMVGKVIVTNVKNYGDISGTTFIGGAVGEMLQSGGITNAKVSYVYNYGDTTAVEMVGGVVGVAKTGSVDHIYNYGTVKSTTTAVLVAVGGLVGQVELVNGQTAFTFNLTYSENHGNVIGIGLVSGVLGFAKNPTVVNNCKNLATITGTGDSVGGILGKSQANVSMTSCVNQGAVSGKGAVGGVAGHIAAGGTINRCSNSGGAVTATAGYCGGLIGYAANTIINNNVGTGYTKGTVTGTTDVGGFVGYMKTGEINGGNNNTTLKGDQYVGGIAGRTSGVTITEVTNNTGSVSQKSNNGVQIGGLVGQLTEYSHVINSTNKVKVTASTQTAGIAAYLGAGSTVVGCENTATATITSQGGAAGIVYHLNGAYIEDCINRATIDAVSFVGGISGNITTGDHVANAIIIDCQNYGTIKANTHAGGIAGNTSSADIIRCTNSGAVNVTKNLTITENMAAQGGGIVGYATNATVIEDCTNTGAVTGNHTEKGSTVGGITGYLGGAITSNNAYIRYGYCSQLINGTNSGTIKSNGTDVTSTKGLAGQNNGWIYTLTNGVITNVSAAKGTANRPSLVNRTLQVTADGVADEAFWATATNFGTKTTTNGTTTIKGARMTEGVKGVAFLVTVTQTKNPTEKVSGTDGTQWYHYSNMEIRFNGSTDGADYKCYINGIGQTSSRYTNEGMIGGFKSTLANGKYTCVYEFFIPYTAIFDGTANWGVAENSPITFRIGGGIISNWETWYVGTSSDWSNAGTI